jgi:hypothetical protein
MIGVTAFGLVFTPVFYVITQWIGSLAARRRPPPARTLPQPAE